MAGFLVDELVHLFKSILFIKSPAPVLPLNYVNFQFLVKTGNIIHQAGTNPASLEFRQIPLRILTAST